MQALLKVAAFLFGLYLLLWLSVAAYFSYASGHEELLEAHLSKVFGRTVAIESVETSWHQWSPRVRITGFSVAGDTPDVPALAFDSLAAELDAVSALRLWPQFNEFAIEKPRLEVVSVSTRQLQVAGFNLQAGRSEGVSPKRLIEWLLNHENLVWHDGEIIWRRMQSEDQRYSDISFVYERQNQARSVRATTLTPKGVLAFKAESNGHVLAGSNWDASLEVLGAAGARLLSPEDLSLRVSNGRGHLSLKSLDIERVRDILRLSGVGAGLRWILESRLHGTLHNVEFEFFGPLLEFSEWSLQANASDVGFAAVSPVPAMNNMSGQLKASDDGGEFHFAANEATFDWPGKLEAPISDVSSSGELRWSYTANADINLALVDAQISDPTITMTELNAAIELDDDNRSVSNVGQLFKLKSIGDLDFEDGTMIARSTADVAPLFLDASLRFAVKDMRQLVNYIPNTPKLQKLRSWWQGAILSGSASNGRLSYRGDLSSNGLRVGKAQLTGTVDYEDVEIDYGFQQDWPVVRRGRGSARLDNDRLTFMPTEVWLEEDQILQPTLEISDLFRFERRLDLTGKIKTSLSSVAAFLFNGPLIKAELRDRPPPVQVTDGQVDATMEISVPLSRVSQSRVKGSAEITQGQFMLPPGVPVNNIRTNLVFTERSASAEDIRAVFMGHNAQARLETTKLAQPPILRLSGSGLADVNALEPWLGKHLLSWFSGQSKWAGSVLIDGPETTVQVQSDLRGTQISAPTPLFKPSEESRELTFTTTLGSADTRRRLGLKLGDQLRVQMAGDLKASNTLLDKCEILMAEEAQTAVSELRDGLHFKITQPQLNLDDWFSAIIDLTRIEVAAEGESTFLDAMRSIELDVDEPVFLQRRIGALKLNGLSVDGKYWIGSLRGSNIDGTLQANPRTAAGEYRFNLARMHLPSAPRSVEPPEPVNSRLQPASYPLVELRADSFKLDDKKLGSLHVIGAPDNDVWRLQKFELQDQGIKTTASGQWANNPELGTISSFHYNTAIDQAGDVLEGMDFAGILKKGRGSLVGNLNWIGAPHEFDYVRLNGDFDLRISDGELVKVEPGGGKLVGLLNFNAIARRLTLDFRDIFASGLRFDRMRYAGVLADGKAIMRDAYIFSPAIFAQMEGLIDLDKELVDLEIHLSPELGGNLTLFSALANPAAGAVMFLTQQLFKDEMRASNLQSYQAKGSWTDFKLEAIKRENGVIQPTDTAPAASPTEPQVSAEASSIDG